MESLTFKTYLTQFEGKALSWKQYHAANKPALVLLHGFCEDASIWDKILTELINDFNIIVPDLPGFGNSDVQENQSMESMADAVKYMLDEACVSKPVMVGHSMGGYITLAFASKYKNHLSGFGLFHSTVLPDSEEKKENRLKTIEFIKANGAAPFARVLLPTLFSDHASDSLINEALIRGCSCTSEGLCAAATAMRNRPDYTYVIQETQLPVLFVAGRFDAGIPVSVSSAQATLTPHASLYILEGSGHCGMVEEPERAIYILKEFTLHCQLYHHEN